jgi:Photosynthetic reaction centre cytochrome C subunit
MRLPAVMGVVLLVCATTAGSAPSDQPDPHLTELLHSIEGKEDLPASQVFHNVKLLGDLPAARFLRIMDVGFSRSLGVECTYCHVEDEWDLDDKRPKRAAREMWQLVGTINDRLGQLKEIDSEEAAVNCTTCHRGYVKPALQMR